MFLKVVCLSIRQESREMPLAYEDCEGACCQGKTAICLKTVMSFSCQDAGWKVLTWKVCQ
jgi:hypothetical protein